MPNFGGSEILIVAIVILVIFGGAAIPRFARNIGKAQHEFKKGLSEGAAEADAERDSGKGAAPDPKKTDSA